MRYRVLKHSKYTFLNYELQRRVLGVWFMVRFFDSAQQAELYARDKFKLEPKTVTVLEFEI